MGSGPWGGVVDAKIARELSGDDCDFVAIFGQLNCRCETEDAGPVWKVD
jgi:hypothetical protein